MVTPRVIHTNTHTHTHTHTHNIYIYIYKHISDSAIVRHVGELRERERELRARSKSLIVFAADKLTFPN